MSRETFASWFYRSPFWQPIIVFCILVGLCGSQRRMGFTGTFLLSLVITPVIGLLVLLITGPSRRAEMARRAELARQTGCAAAEQLGAIAGGGSLALTGVALLA